MAFFAVRCSIYQRSISSLREVRPLAAPSCFARFGLASCSSRQRCGFSVATRAFCSGPRKFLSRPVAVHVLAGKRKGFATTPAEEKELPRITEPWPPQLSENEVRMGLLKMVLREKKLVGGGILMGIGAVIGEFAGLHCFGLAVEALPLGFEVIMPILAMYAIASVAEQGGYSGVAVTGVFLSEKVAGHLRHGIVDVLLRQQPMSALDSQKVGDLLSRINTDTSTIRTVLGPAFSQSYLSAVKMVVGGAYLFYLSTMLAVVPVGACIGIGALALAIASYLEKITKHQLEAQANSTALAKTLMSNVRIVRLFSAERREVGEYSKHNQHIVNLGYKIGYAEFGLELCWRMGLAGVIISSFGMGAYYQVPVAATTSFVLAAMEVANAAGDVSTSVTDLGKSAGAATEPMRLMRLQEDWLKQRQNVIEPRPGEPAIEFGNVFFSYTPPGRAPVPVLQDVSFSVGVGETVALLGSSGSGKSTALQLLQGFYGPSAGIVRVFGCDITTIQPQSLYATVTAMQQKAALFGGRTVRANIAYYDPEGDANGVEEAAKRARADDFIMQLPEGYDSVLDGEEDGQLSGGQAQRVTLARALIRDSKIVLLDEPTSALDAASAEHVERSLAELLQSRSALLVTHDTNLAQRLADRCVVLGKGGIMLEEGKPKELLSRGGAFAALCAQQSQTDQWAR